MAENKDNTPQTSQAQTQTRGGRGFGGRGGGPMARMGPKVRPKNSKETIRRLLKYVGKQKSTLIVVFILTAISTVLAVLGPLLIGVAIDRYIMPRDYSGLLRLSVALLGIYALSALMSALQAYIMASVAQKTVRDMREDLFAKIQSLPLRFFDSKTHGELMSRTTNDIENVTNTLSQSLTQLVSNFLTVVGTLIMMFILSIPLTLMSLIMIPAIMLVTGKIASKTRKYFGEQQKNLGELNGFIEETISGQKVVKVHCREEKAQEKFGEINAKLKQC